MDVSETERRNTEQVRRAATEQSGLPASREAMTEAKVPQYDGGPTQPMPPQWPRAERLLLNAEAKAADVWPPPDRMPDPPSR
jgi:hypothetical protein